MNVGASSETEYGNYYQYGKGAAQYATTSGDTDYTGMEEPIAASADTVVQVWGGLWRMPTREQVRELTANTTYEWVTNYKGSGINGGKFTASNGNYLFFPAAGFYMNGGLWSIGDEGDWWVSHTIDEQTVVALYIWNSGVEDGGEDRKRGHSVRGVVG